ncbi:MAG TPA: hypothetical protein PLN93_07435 [Vicinamibacterales bacterium]|nr:hypothetical protein [Vicinamibacterales bacterium]HOG29945.1 hypothetical protein [Vicinamibacterales bacterium]HOQ60568.1 hypothetical protein [Vicinamibacterales bacterium]HPK71758.1 hypothetical protein [Vicinamibacterales bacterium]HPW20848.1 hypothetical protein [Vicinamibacterales bacterium]
MARGFDSKSVEYQQEEAQRSRERMRERELTREEVARVQRCRTLELAHARAAADLGRAAAPAQREMLQQALAALESELASLAR